MNQGDIPSLVLSSFGWLGHMRVLLLEARDEVAAVRDSLARLATGASFGPVSGRPDRAWQVALTASGLRRLGLGPEVLASFPRAFTGKAEDEHRLRALGDRGESGPASWAWSGDRIDAALFVYAANEDDLEQCEIHLRQSFAAGFEVVHQIGTSLLDHGREHFGFRDGLSQPGLRDMLEPREEGDVLAAGEVLLGHRDETGEVPATPHDGTFDLGRDGTYLVLRQLEQDVAGFWRMLGERAGEDGDPVALAAKMIGRTPGGTPLSPGSPETPLRYGDDLRGLHCPKGAHIRWANPRDALHEDPEVSLAMVRRHRLLRRGRPYGSPAPPDLYPPGVAVTRGAETGTIQDERGLLFVSLGADIARQFEHVQQTWLNNPKHDGLHDEACPITSGRAITADARRYTLPARPLRQRLRELPHFVRVRGSAYLFLPSRGALQHLASTPRPQPPRPQLPELETG